MAMVFSFHSSEVSGCSARATAGIRPSVKAKDSSALAAKRGVFVVAFLSGAKGVLCFAGNFIMSAAEL